MKRVFVSVPMTGRHVEDIQADIEKAEKEYCKKHPNETVCFVHAYSNYSNEDIGGYVHPELYYLGRAIQKMGTCDEVIYAGDIDDICLSRGCQVETLVDLLYFSRDKQAS